MRPNAFERFVGAFSPGWLARRLHVKSVIQKRLFASKAYEAAGMGRRLNNWKPSIADADTLNRAPLPILRARSRDLVRNNPYAERFVTGVVNNVVGYGILPKIEDPREKQEWEAWAESTSCDYYRDNDFWGLQALAMRTVVESGEVLIRRVIEQDRMSLQLLEPDFLDTNRDQTFNDGSAIKNGIKFDEKGRVLSYFLLREHPGSNQGFSGLKAESVEVPAADIIHLYRQTRPGQTRAAPWLTPVMVRLKDLDEYEDTQLVRQKIAACFVGFIHDTEASATSNIMGQDDEMNEKFQPGAWERLPPGTDIKLGSPPTVGTDYDPYIRRMLIGVAAGLNVPYEVLTGDLSNVNFSSGRMGWLEFHRSIENWRWTMLVPRFFNRAYAWFHDWRVINGRTRSELLLPTWTPPRREMIDPSREVVAMKDSIRSGLSSLSDSLRQLGHDPEELLREIESDNTLIDKLGLVLDSDPRNERTEEGGANEREDGSEGRGNVDRD